MMSQNYVFIEQWPIRFELPVFVQWYCFRSKKLDVWHQTLSRSLHRGCGLGTRLDWVIVYSIITSILFLIVSHWYKKTLYSCKSNVMGGLIMPWLVEPQKHTVVVMCVLVIPWDSCSHFLCDHWKSTAETCNASLTQYYLNWNRVGEFWIRGFIVELCHDYFAHLNGWLLIKRSVKNKSPQQAPYCIVFT